MSKPTTTAEVRYPAPTEPVAARCFHPWKYGSLAEMIGRRDVGHEIDNRPGFPVMPWSLAQLDGSEWVNIYVGKLTTVEYLDNKLKREWDYRPYLWDVVRWVESSFTFGGYLVLGGQHNYDYVIEHDIRIDQLPIEKRLWARFFALKRQREDMEQAARTLEGSLNGYRQRQIEAFKRIAAGDDLRRVTREVYAFAEAAGLTMPPELDALAAPSALKQGRLF